MLHSRSFLHSFPARMAPDIALDAIARFPQGSTVIDPMVGSGTVAITAVAAGHRFIGCDMDPLATLIAHVSTSRLDYSKLQELADNVIARTMQIDSAPSDLDWIDEGDETHRFIEFWFGERQRRDLSGLARQIVKLADEHVGPEADALRVALSRIIVTKESKASLARDTSHSRPHKVAEFTEYDVIKGFKHSISELMKRHARLCTNGEATIFPGDARSMHTLEDACGDAIVSSPPYLNAIDYLRGHKLSLVWLGYSIPEIRRLRSRSVGAERRREPDNVDELEVLKGFGDLSDLPQRQKSMIARYAHDLRQITMEAARVLKPGGTAVYVIGNSCLRGVHIDNATALRNAAELSSLKFLCREERKIPSGNRYLPTPEGKNSLARRMKKEVVFTFENAYIGV